MSEPPALGVILGTRWVHAFEEDTADGDMYCPLTAAVPLSRRPRLQFELDAHGAARLFESGADDRPVARPATWRATTGGFELRDTNSGQVWAIRVMAPDRLRLHKG